MSSDVTAPEGALLTLARGVLGLTTAVDLSTMLVNVLEPPSKLGPTARSLLQDTLARGTVLALARSGGWAESHQGRVWQSRPLPTFAFTGNSIRLLQWVLKTPLADHDVAQLVLEQPLSPVEEVFAVLLLQRSKGLAAEAALARQNALRASPLVVLAHAGTLALARALPTQVPAIRLAEHGVYLAGLRDLMAKSWAHDELSKREIERPEVMIRLGEAQANVGQAFLDAVSDSLPMRGLAGFFIEAARQWLSTPRSAADYIAAMNATAPLRERVEARKSAAALMRIVTRLSVWHAEHRAMHFVDDDFAVGQALIKAWSPFGEAGFREAQQLVSQLDALPD